MWFVIDLMIGAFVGVFVTALMNAAGNDRRD